MPFTVSALYMSSAIPITERWRILDNHDEFVAQSGKDVPKAWGSTTSLREVRNPGQGPRGFHLPTVHGLNAGRKISQT